MGCVYFNTFYNAERYYAEGERLVRVEGRTDEVPPQARTSFEKAVEKASTVIRSHPDSKYADDALLLLGKAHERLGNHGEAALALRTLLEEHRESELRDEATLWLARAARRAGDLASARDAVALLSGRDDLSDEARFQAELEEARVALEAGDGERALALLAALQERQPDLARSHDVDLLSARARLANGDPRGALGQLRGALASATNPQRQRRAAEAMAEVLAAAGTGAEARSAYRELLAQGLPDSLAASVQAALGASHAASGESPEAVEAYGAAARLLPGTPLAGSALYHRGLLEWRRQGDRAAARETLLEAFLQAPESPVADSAAGAARTIAEIEHYASIRAGSERVPSPLPEEEVQATATYLLAELLYTAEGDEARARELFEEMLRRYPGSEWTPKVLYTLGWLQAQAGGSGPSAYDERLLREFPDTQYASYARQRLAPGAAPASPPDGPHGAGVAESSAVATAAPQVVEEEALPSAGADSADTSSAGADLANETVPVDAAGETAAEDSAGAAVAEDSAGAADAAISALASVPRDVPAAVGSEEAAPARGLLALPPDEAAPAAPPLAESLDARLFAFSRALPRPPDPLLGIQDRLLARQREAAAERREDGPSAAAVRAAEIAAEQAGGAVAPADTTGGPAPGAPAPGPAPPEDLDTGERVPAGEGTERPRELPD